MQRFVSVLALSLSLTPAALAGEICPLGWSISGSGVVTVTGIACCTAGCGPVGTGCATANGNEFLGAPDNMMSLLGGSCTTAAEREFNVGPTTGTGDVAGDDCGVGDEATATLGVCEPVDDLNNVQVLSHHIKDGIEADISVTKLFSDAPSQASIDAAAEALTGEAGSAAALLEVGDYVGAFAQFRSAQQHLDDAKAAGGDTAYLTEVAENLALMSSRAVLKEAQALGSTEDELAEGWSAIDEANQMVRDGEAADQVFEVLERAAAFGRGTRSPASQTGGKTELL